MNEKTAGKDWQCEGRMQDAARCKAPARAFFRDSDDSVHRFCVHHSLLWRKEIKQFKHALGVEILSLDDD